MRAQLLSDQRSSELNENGRRRSTDSDKKNSIDDQDQGKRILSMIRIDAAFQIALTVANRIRRMSESAIAEHHGPWSMICFLLFYGTCYWQLADEKVYDVVRVKFAR
jgi:hypothetical protein